MLHEDVHYTMLEYLLRNFHSLEKKTRKKRNICLHTGWKCFFLQLRSLTNGMYFLLISFFAMDDSFIFVFCCYFLRTLIELPQLNIPIGNVKYWSMLLLFFFFLPIFKHWTCCSLFVKDFVDNRTSRRLPLIIDDDSFELKLKIHRFISYTINEWIYQALTLMIHTCEMSLIDHWEVVVVAVVMVVYSKDKSWKKKKKKIEKNYLFDKCVIGIIIKGRWWRWWWPEILNRIR